VGWRRNTALIAERCGSGGSHLFDAGDGTFVAIALWPNGDAWECCIPPFDDEASALVRSATIERFAALELESIDDLWNENLL